MAGAALPAQERMKTGANRGNLESAADDVGRLRSEQKARS